MGGDFFMKVEDEEIGGGVEVRFPSRLESLKGEERNWVEGDDGIGDEGIKLGVVDVFDLVEVDDNDDDDDDDGDDGDEECGIDDCGIPKSGNPIDFGKMYCGGGKNSGLSRSQSFGRMGLEKLFLGT